MGLGGYFSFLHLNTALQQGVIEAVGPFRAVKGRRGRWGAVEGPSGAIEGSLGRCRADGEGTFYCSGLLNFGIFLQRILMETHDFFRLTFISFAFLNHSSFINGD